jgi:hypothetical protein
MRLFPRYFLVFSEMCSVRNEQRVGLFQKFAFLCASKHMGPIAETHWNGIGGFRSVFPEAINR